MAPRAHRGTALAPRPSPALRKLDFHFLSNLMGYDRGDSDPFDFELNGIPFGSKSNGTLSPRLYPIRFKGNGSLVFSVCRCGGLGSCTTHREIFPKSY